MRDIKARLCAAAAILGIYPWAAAAQTPRLDKPAHAHPGKTATATAALASRGDILAGAIKQALDAGGWRSVNEYLGHREEYLAFRNGVEAAFNGGAAAAPWTRTVKFGTPEYSEQLRLAGERVTAFRAAHATSVVTRAEATQRKAGYLISDIARQHPELTRAARFEELEQLKDNGPNRPILSAKETVADAERTRQRQIAAARADAEGKMVRCEKRWPGDKNGLVSSYEYYGYFTIANRRLVSGDRSPTLLVHFRPQSFVVLSGLVAKHSDTAELVVGYDRNYVPVFMTVYDGGYTFKQAIGGIFAGLFDGNGALMGAKLVSKEKTASIGSGSTLVSSGGSADDAKASGKAARQHVNYLLAANLHTPSSRTPISQASFVTSVPGLDKRLQSYAATGNRSFAGTHYDAALPHGGSRDQACIIGGPPGLPGCFLTTAAVGAVGLPDDCWELRQLRALRDRMAAGGGEPAALVRDYYRTAPAIVRGINARCDARRIWLRTWLAGIVPAALCARLGCDGAALALYRHMTNKLRTLAAVTACPPSRLS